MGDNYKARVDAVLASGVVLPSPPAALLKLQRLMATESAGMRELAETVAHDPALTGALMRVANSPVFRPRTAPRTAADALILLGRTRTLAVAASTALKQQTQGLDSYAVDYLWTCSGAAADATFRAARASTAKGLADAAYLAALVQDAGVAVMLRRHPAHASMFRSPARGLESAVAALDALTGTDHAAVAHLVARNWKLPAAVADALAVHHQPGAAAQSSPEAGSLAVLMAVGRWLRDGMGEDGEALGEEMRNWLQLAGQQLGLDVEARARLRSERES